MVRAGERSVARDNDAPSFPQAFNSARWDAFDHWSQQRRSARTGTTSAQYLPPEVQMYGGVFDRYGSWTQLAPYGYVWYPSTTIAWRPYYFGFWSHVGPYGWTWIGTDPWTWPTHHYGRWGYGRGSWFWIPGRRWAPAWVHWAVAPGYVSWCPLGYDGQPVAGFWAGSYSQPYYDPWFAWVVVPRYSFLRGTPIARVAVDGHRLSPGAATNFVTQAAAPLARATAVPRPAPPPVSAGLAVPRPAPIGTPQRPLPDPVLTRPPAGGSESGRLLPEERLPLEREHRATARHPYAPGTVPSTGSAIIRSPEPPLVIERPAWPHQPIADPHAPTVGLPHERDPRFPLAPGTGLAMPRETPVPVPNNPWTHPSPPPRDEIPQMRIPTDVIRVPSGAGSVPGTAMPVPAPPPSFATPPRSAPPPAPAPPAAGTPPPPSSAPPPQAVPRDHPPAGGAVRRP